MSPKIYFPLAARTRPLEGSRTELSLSGPGPASTPRGGLNTAVFCPPVMLLHPQHQLTAAPYCSHQLDLLRQED